MSVQKIVAFLRGDQVYEEIRFEIVALIRSVVRRIDRCVVFIRRGIRRP